MAGCERIRHAVVMQFEGKVFLVTGGGRGIGRAIVKRLADEGGRVCILDSDVAAGRDAADEYGDRVRFEKCNVSREADVRRAITATIKWGRRLDGAVNNAGIADPEVGPTERIALRTWQKFLDVNLTGSFLVAKHSIAHLRRTRGSIVNLGSTRAIQSEPDTIPYAATKGGIVALTHSLAISLGPEIRVNCLSPGWIATDSYAPRKERKAPRLRKVDHAQHPAGRVGRPEDVAALCAWLLSDEAGFVTGANYLQDGGMTRKMIYA
jgi:NAD(P)-dependent dehydrogenase (short-subunit alcohol dehydrogenase family)